MALSVLSFSGLVITAVLSVIQRGASSNFPLSDCSRRDLDILALLFENGDSDDKSYQLQSSSNFIKHVSGSSYNETHSRVFYAYVYDKYSADNPKVDVRAWHLLSSTEFPIYGNENKHGSHSQYTKLNKILEIKVAFVDHLFSEMAGVRENATHIAIIFIDGARLLRDNNINKLNTVDRHNGRIKVFVVVIGGDHGNQTIYLGDALLVPDYIQEASTHILSLALCSQCEEGWFLFKYNDSSDSLSCYVLFEESLYESNWLETMDKCYKKGGYLAAIETEQEFIFLRSLVFDYIKNKILGRFQTALYHIHTTPVYIGLIRDTTIVSKRFQWSLRFPAPSRPFLAQKYWWQEMRMPYNRECGLWLFSWDHYYDYKDEAPDTYEIITQYAEVICTNRANHYGLCEITLPRRHDEIDMVRISPATEERFHKALNKTKSVQIGDGTLFNTQVLMFGDNFVSVSANIGSTHFQKCLRDTGREFPVFDCGEDAGHPRYISYIYVCDFIDHCQSSRDELYCNRKERLNVIGCSGVYCCDSTCLPIQYVNDMGIDCRLCEYVTDLDDEDKIRNKHLLSNTTCAFMCNDGSTCIELSKLNDGRTDCHGPEGPLDETIGKLKAANTCFNVLDHTIWAPLCVYVKDIYGAVMGCRDMSHLNGCTNFTCSEGYVKCPKTYCIPQHYVLDGKADCPTGEDEYSYNADRCFRNFACSYSNVCLHPDLICDGRTDCPHGDDEVDCNVHCSDGFYCISGTVTVSGYNISIPLKNDQLINDNTRYIDLSGVDMSLMGQLLLDGKKNVQFINWSNCKIRNLFRMFSLTSSRIVRLDISYNLIQTFSGSDITFHALDNIRHLNLSYNRELVFVNYLQFKFLETLDLSNTGISYLDESFMIGLPVMKHLNMSYTHISHVHKYVFSSNITLQTLDFRGIHFDTFYTDLFNGLIISQHLYADNFEMCCPQIRGANIPSYTCHTKDNAMSSCFELVGSNVQRVLLWVVAVLAVLGNVTVIAYRVWWDKSVIRTGYRLFVTNLGVSDCIMGFYLFIIAGADYYYRDNYVLYDKRWRESIECGVAGVLAALSLETSTLFCFLVTLDRFLTVKLLFRNVQFSQLHKIMCVLLSWVICFILALAPVLFNFKTYSSNSMCLDLPLTQNRLKGWEYSFSVYIVHNFVVYLVVAYGQISIFRSVSGKRRTSSPSRTQSQGPGDVVVAKQLFLVVFSRSVPWLCVGILGLFSLGDNEISNEVYSWITVVVLPIHSAAHPFLYQTPVLLAKWEMFKHGGRSNSRTLI